MEEMLDNIKSSFAFLGGVLAWFLGSVDGLVLVLLAFVVVDYITGLIRAGNGHKVSSRIGFIGITKKVMIFLIVGVSHMVDAYLLTEANGLLRTAVIFFYIANEGISILENCALLGLPVPSKLKNVLIAMKEETENEKTTDDR